MVWTDPISSALGANLVLHDLDLSVKNERTGRVHFPNGLNQRETRHNVEKVSATGPPAHKMIHACESVPDEFYAY
jgi:hypothetical protein